MPLKFVIDMNLSFLWENVLRREGIKAVHWSNVGDPKAPDRDIMDWANRNDHIVFTHDLDFGARIAVT